MKKEKKWTNRKGIFVEIFFFERVWIVAAHYMRVRAKGSLESNGKWMMWEIMRWLQWLCVCVFVCNAHKNTQKERVRWNLRLFRLSDFVSIFAETAHKKAHTQWMWNGRVSCILSYIHRLFKLLSNFYLFLIIIFIIKSTIFIYFFGVNYLIRGFLWMFLTSPLNTTLIIFIGIWYIWTWKKKKVFEIFILLFYKMYISVGIFKTWKQNLKKNNYL